MISLLRRAARLQGLFPAGRSSLFAVGEGFDPTQFKGIELDMLVALLVA